MTKIGQNWQNSENWPFIINNFQKKSQKMADNFEKIISNGKNGKKAKIDQLFLKMNKKLTLDKR
jgi:hypothetical protein